MSSENLLSFLDKVKKLDEVFLSDLINFNLKYTYKASNLDFINFSLFDYGFTKTKEMVKNGLNFNRLNLDFLKRTVFYCLYHMDSLN